MAKFIVRYSDNYSIVVDAVSEEEALNKAEKIPEEEWDCDQSEMDAEPTGRGVEMNLWRREYRFELAVFLMDYHSGQSSRGYRLLSKLDPHNFSSRLCEEMRETEAYQAFETKYANKV